MQEIELKFLIPESRLKGLLRQAKVKSSKSIKMAAHYYDTPTQALAKAGIGLRIRREGADWVQTIKSGGDGLAARLEHNKTLDNEQVQAMLANDTLLPNLNLYADTSIAPALADFKLKKLAKDLTCQYITDVERIKRLITDESGSSIEVAYDNGCIVQGNDDTQQQLIQEIEFELVSGDIKFLFDTAKVWCKRYKLCLSTVTKAERGGLLVKGLDYSPAVSADITQLEVDQDSTMPEFIRATVHNCLLQILPNSSAIVAGSRDSGHILQLHIGICRLHSALIAFEDFSDQINLEWLPILQQTASLLSEYHSIDYLANVIETTLQQQGAPQVEWSAELSAIKATPSNVICANDFQLTLLELIEFTMSHADDEPYQDELAESRLCNLLSKRHKRVLKSIEQLGSLERIGSKLNSASKADATDPKTYEQHHNLIRQTQHKTRQQLKDLRYISEFAAPIYAKKKEKRAVKRWLDSLIKAQKILDQYHDYRQYQQRYQQKSAIDINAFYGSGWFMALLENEHKISYKHLNEFKENPKFW